MALRWPIGRPVEDLDTPALVLDIDIAQRNIDRMADFFAGKHCKLRPHFKNHKCPQLMKRQLVREAVGVTCAKVGEAEVCVRRGMTDVLIANQVVGARKIERLLNLIDPALVRVAVDDADNCREISRMAEAAGKQVGVLVEVEIGMKRCGVMPGEPTLELARLIESLPGVRFDGLQGFEGHSVLMVDDNERNSVTGSSIGLMVETRRLIEAAGIPVAIVSGGGTGTYDLTGTMPGVDELQAGTYVTMDWRYKDTRPEFELALSVLATCISAKEPNRAVLDVGVKGVGAEFGPPRVMGRPDIEITFFLSEEHGFLNVHGEPLRVGQKVHLLPSHACTTCNLHRRMFVCSEGRVVDVWPIEGSGKLQ
jgi:D-serine deaminase-like pyridoxal phosphate-dependent protein